MLSWMLWLLMLAAVRGATLLPCSKAWKASATASGATPCSADTQGLSRAYKEVCGQVRAKLNESRLRRQG